MFDTFHTHVYLNMFQFHCLNQLTLLNPSFGIFHNALKKMENVSYQLSV
jgi:hypothetical protein